MSNQPETSGWKTALNFLGAILGTILAYPAILFIFSGWYGLPVLALGWFFFWLVSAQIKKLLKGNRDKKGD